MTPRDRRAQLCEVEVRHILPYTCIRLDLVEEVATFCKLEGEPYPGCIFAMAEVSDDVVMRTDFLMQRELDEQLFGP